MAVEEGVEEREAARERPVLAVQLVEQPPARAPIREGGHRVKLRRAGSPTLCAAEQVTDTEGRVWFLGPLPGPYEIYVDGALWHLRHGADALDHQAEACPL